MAVEQRLRCPKCRLVFVRAEGPEPVCPGCGFERPNSPALAHGTASTSPAPLGWVAVVTAPPASVAGLRNNRVAAASMVVSLSALLFLFVGAFVPDLLIVVALGPVGLALGLIGRRQLRERYHETGHGLAAAGAVLGAVVTGLLVVMVLLIAYAPAIAP